ncbi:RabGAP/TBC, partial [Backusella circina FSU 941]
KIRAGGSIPAKDRGRVWQELSNSDSLHLETLYQQLIHETTPYKQLIQRDITRTFPNSEMFSQESGQRAMERVLHAYSLYDDEINYCQGLAFLVGPLLINMPEQQAFSVFVRLMETHGMRTMFTQSMEGLHLRFYQFDCLLQEFLPDISLFFKEHGVHSQMYLSPWFLTLFAYVLPMDLVMRIYDLVFLQGAAIETMMRVALSLIMRASPHIM